MNSQPVSHPCSLAALSQANKSASSCVWRRAIVTCRRPVWPRQDLTDRYQWLWHLRCNCLLDRARSSSRLARGGQHKGFTFSHDITSHWAYLILAYRVFRDVFLCECSYTIRLSVYIRWVYGAINTR